MKYSTVTRIIIIILFIVVHVTQAYNVSILLGFRSICKIYVTDCNGKVIRNAGRKDCYPFWDSIFRWNEAPDLYCVHAYPITRPKDNKYVMVQKDDVCINLSGDLRSWKIETISKDECN
ncbi:hypothetical protein Glove_198g55 [Diversispora epigaea]|uniref:Uncharacterized protein n=1 Tax=Diversispora epigaea TaxID=1348612 RepID=A0A397IKK4_9GLOM|nr:hypothetical protein Glove_198g55 [Diversispora epigaea]